MINSRLGWKEHYEGTENEFRTKEICLGPWTSHSLIHDPKHMAFVLARYKFCSKILAGKNNVLEVGCGDGFGAPIVAQTVGRLHCVDWDERNIVGNLRRLVHPHNITFETADFVESAPNDIYDGIFNVDVLEHIHPECEQSFIENMTQVLDEHGILVIGTPNKNADMYASSYSKNQHINLKSEETLRMLMNEYFYNTFIFSMNDEVIHTGYYPLAHYLFAISVGKK